MDSSFDAAVIGGGPAGVSAALTLFARGKSVIVISNNPDKSPLFRAESINNYPGFPNITGAELLTRLKAHLSSMNIPVKNARVQNVMPFGGRFNLSFGSDFLNCGVLIICTGITNKTLFPGESEFLGKGVSYCATCDGMLYRGKKIAVISKSVDGAEEAELLRSIGCNVEFFDNTRAKSYKILGGSRVESLEADGVIYPVDAVFILRDTVVADTLLPGISCENGAIAVSDDMLSSIPGVFAAGDCTGKPYQISKAVGQGCVAALSAAAYLDREKNA